MDGLTVCEVIEIDNRLYLRYPDATSHGVFCGLVAENLEPSAEVLLTSKRILVGVVLRSFKHFQPSLRNCRQ